MTVHDHRIDARDWSLLAVLSVLWGGSFFFNGVVLRELPPLTVVLLRVALAAIILLPMLWIYRIRFPVGLAGWKPFFAVALLNNVLPFCLIVTGQTYVSSGLASILNATTPLFTVLVMAAAGDEKLHARRVAGVVIGLIGVAIIHGRDFGFASGQAFRHAALPCRRLQLWPGGALRATQTVELAAACDRDISIAGVQPDDGDRRRCDLERPWQLPMPGPVNMAGAARPVGAVDRAGVHRVLSDPATFWIDQCHAGDAADSRHRNLARLSRAGRKHLAPRDHRCCS